MLYNSSHSTVSLQGNGNTFRGFLIQARDTSESTVGVFANPGSGADYQLSSCTPANSGVTHIAATDKSLTNFTWTAPSSGQGDISLA